MAAPRDANAHPKAPVKASPTVVVPPTSAKKVERSPNYPAVGPSVALEYAEKIWKLDKRNPMSSELACGHMGYTTKNGASQTMLGAPSAMGCWCLPVERRSGSRTTPTSCFWPLVITPSVGSS